MTVTDPVLAAAHWPTNADLIADVARLGYITEGDVTLDATYGRGLWWTKWRPMVLVTNDAHTEADTTYDFRRLPQLWTDTFDVVAYDPPYCAQGGRKTSTTQDYNDRYGRPSAPMSAKGTQELINDGLVEMARVVRPRGIVLVKCKDYVWSGKLWPGTHHTLTAALGLGFRLVDRFEHIGTPGPQPPRDRQCHARRNLSTLFVLEAARFVPVTELSRAGNIATERAQTSCVWAGVETFDGPRTPNIPSTTTRGARP